MNVYRAARQFERFLFLTPHESADEEEGKLIATIIYNYDKKTVTVIREDDKEHPINI